MDSTYIFGLLLVGLSAILLASHWQRGHWQRGDRNRGRKSSHRGDNNLRWQTYAARTSRRRAVASSLIGLVGFTLMAFETVPRTPLSITAYLFSLVLMTCWILWLACLDLLAGRRFQEDEQLDQIADKLRHGELETAQTDSAEM